MTVNKAVSKILLYGFIILGALISLFPFYWLAVMATNSSAAFMRFPPVMVFGGQFMTNMTNLLNSIPRQEVCMCTVPGDQDDSAPAQPDTTADHHE